MRDNDGMAFSTPDVDNDVWTRNCANRWRGAWWFRWCSQSNLNAFAYGSDLGYDKMFWAHFNKNDRALKSSVMKIIRTA